MIFLIYPFTIFMPKLENLPELHNGLPSLQGEQPDTSRAAIERIIQAIRSGQTDDSHLLKGPVSRITGEEAALAKEAEAAGGESKLPREKAIRLIALRYMRPGHYNPPISDLNATGSEERYRESTTLPLSEDDAMELATIEYDGSVGAPRSPSAVQRGIELRRSRRSLKTGK